MIADCPGCIAGNHARHVEHWGKRTEGIIDGDFCHCSGDCAERAKNAYEDFMGLWARPLVEDLVSPEALRLLDALDSPDPTIRNAAVLHLNRLMDDDPLPGERPAGGAL